MLILAAGMVCKTIVFLVVDYREVSVRNSMGRSRPARLARYLCLEENEGCILFIVALAVVAMAQHVSTR